MNHCMERSSLPQPFTAAQQIKVNKAVGPDNVPAWVLTDNTSLRDGVIPALRKTARYSTSLKTTSTVDRKRYSSNFAYHDCFKDF